MATLTFTGNLFGRTLTDTAQDLTLFAASGKNVKIRLGDNVGLNKLEIDNDLGAVISSTSSLGNAVLNSVTASQNYVASGFAGSVAAAQATIPAALDTLYAGNNTAWNELSPQTPNGALLVFETVSQKKFIAGKVMVFVGGLKQRPGDDYTEVANRFSVAFTQPPPTGVRVEFTYIIG
jgi:hypothetical protein